jgi:hypothetical protein
MRTGTRYNINIFTPINEAACKMMSLRMQGMTVQDYLLADETAMFKEEMGEDISPEGKAILSFMDENKRSTKKISAFLTGMADVVNSYGNPNQTTSSTRRRTSNGYRTEEINSGEKPAEAVKETKKAPAKLAEGYNTESGNTYYVVASALPMREKNFKKSMQKEALLFSKRPSLTTAANGGAVRNGSASNMVGGTEQGANPAIKANASSVTPNVAQSAENVKEQAGNESNPFGFVDNTLKEFEEVAGISAKKEYNNKEEITTGGSEVNHVDHGNGHQNISEGKIPTGVQENVKDRGTGTLRKEQEGTSGEVLSRTNGTVQHGTRERGRLHGERAESESSGSASTGVSKRDDIQLKGESSKTKPLTPAQKKNAKASETPGHNFTITDEDEIGNGGPKAKYKNNIEAIKLLKQIETENRQATPDEQKVLAKYVGWGGLP